MSRVYSSCGRLANDGNPTFSLTGPGLKFCWGHDEPHCFKTAEEAEAVAGLMNRAFQEGQKERSRAIMGLLS